MCVVTLVTVVTVVVEVVVVVVGVEVLAVVLVLVVVVTWPRAAEQMVCTLRATAGLERKREIASQ